MNKTSLIYSFAIFVLGILIAVGPFTILPVCGEKDESGMEMSMDMSMDDDTQTDMQMTADSYMRCHWTALAERGIGLVIAIMGILLIFPASVGFYQGISLGAALNGALAVSVPAFLIGTCANKHSSCNMLAKPGLIILGLFTIGVSVFHILYLYRNAKRPDLAQ
jgi:hypothetical protein